MEQGKATFSGYAVNVELTQGIGLRGFKIPAERYISEVARLRTHKDARGGSLDKLCDLIGGLFERKIITACSVQGSRLDFTLARTDASGRTLLLEGARRRFIAAVEDITGQRHLIPWAETQEKRPAKGGRRSSGDRDGVLETIIDIGVDIVTFAWLARLLGDD